MQDPRRRGKEPKQKRRQCRNQQAQRENDRPAHAKAPFYRLDDPVRTSGAVILPDKTSQGDAVGEGGEIQAALQLGIERHSRHGVRPESVDTGLDQQGRDAHKKRLHPCGQPDLQNIEKLFRGEPFSCQAQGTALVQRRETAQKQRRQQPLGGKRGRRSAADAAMESDHQQHIQRKVQRTGEEEAAQRFAAVAQGAQHRRADVVEKLRRDAAADDTKLWQV